MIKSSSSLLLLSILALGSVSSAHAGEVFQRTETHVIVEWEEGNASPAAVEMAAELGEIYYAAITDWLGHEPKNRVLILLNGPAERPDGSWGYPHVDAFGRVHLYRFGPTHHSYFSALAHEMVHVFRLRRSPNMDWFAEEGIAEFIALKIDDSLDGFPWYGSPVDLVAGQWIARGKDLPLRDLRERHKELNLPCKAQSYALRSSFFDWLGRTRGDEAVLAFAAEKPAGRLESYERHFETDFESLAAEWRGDLLSAYRAMESVESKTAEYLDSPIKYMEVCEGAE